MKMRLKVRAKPLAAVGLGALFLASFFIPFILASREGDRAIGAQTHGFESIEAAAEWSFLNQGPVIPVYRTRSHMVENVPLEAYVRGVLAAEMPAEFEMEALKAQAIAARTFIVKRIGERNKGTLPVQGLGPQANEAEKKAADSAGEQAAVEAWVNDTIEHQVYLSVEEMKQRWRGGEFSQYLTKLTRAVKETEGKVITYGGQPIQASFFSTSNGFTENSEEYWSNAFPYLRSVASPWDSEVSPKFSAVTIFTVDEFTEKLGLGASAKASFIKSGVKVEAYSTGKQIAKLKIGGQTFTGRELREKLELPSATFTIRRSGQEVRIETKGYGHGVGLSQYGANGMALEGKTAEEIISYYYKGVTVENAAAYLPK
ncbi:stage II sporulation protein D [Paenibacillus turpanensis]|uniref:stage II sporulation protein D n=1 Tax=Paenibacillus turpanensis TaxID=2689078 RepID=UPI001FB724CD|nr:stage II sporulation protein D [Paenibacillus turpanensis]